MVQLSLGTLLKGVAFVAAMLGCYRVGGPVGALLPVMCLVGIALCRAAINARHKVDCFVYIVAFAAVFVAVLYILVPLALTAIY